MKCLAYATVAIRLQVSKQTVDSRYFYCKSNQLHSEPKSKSTPVPKNSLGYVPIFSHVSHGLSKGSVLFVLYAEIIAAKNIKRVKILYFI